jgi:ribonuclease VapC
MIVVDSSALIAILFNEVETQSFEAILSGGDRCVISAVNAHETACVLRLRHDQAMVEELWRLLEENEIEIVPFDEIQVRRPPSRLIATAKASTRKRGSISAIAQPTHSPRP